MQKRQALWMDLIGIVEIGTIYFAYTSIVSYFEQWTGQATLQVDPLRALTSCFDFSSSFTGHSQCISRSENKDGSRARTGCLLVLSEQGILRLSNFLLRRFSSQAAQC